LSKGQTKSELEKLMKLQPKVAYRVQGDELIEIAVEQIQTGDLLLVKPGMQVPVDGIIVEGNSTIDESMISGESIPVDKYIGDQVISATINQSGRIIIKAEKVGNETTLNQIIDLVEKASMTKAPIQRLADTISLYFVPFVILVSTISFALWLISGETFSFALSMGITVLVISCPCALGLATPVAMMVGTGKGAEYGVLYKTAEAIQKCEKINTIILDKTGTITLGKPIVTDMIFLNDSNPIYNEIIQTLESNSTHPLAQSILKYYEKQNIAYIKLENITETPGFGMTGKYLGKAYYVGNKRWLDTLNIQQIENQDQISLLEKEGKTIVYFFDEYNVLGVIALRDEIKPSSKLAIEKMKKKFDQVIMLTGDNEQSALFWKEELGITKVYYQVLPNEKDEIVQKYKDNGNKVAMIGDGINDSIALVRADVGISLGTGSDIAKSAADVLLIKDDLMDAYFALTLSKKTMNNVRMNLFFAFIYNVVLIPVAAGVFFTSFGLKLNPVYGSFAMSLSSVTVVLNALRLKLIQPNRGEKNEKRTSY
ncbi:MAG: copper-translocating P-type ATPase, partial [Candidatus Izemoplasmatales bacterium]